jgi:DNA-binding LacI/PurR family transcriptional regulator
MRKKNGKSIVDIADALGISTSTVSRALRQLPSISAETTKAVLAEAQRQGYWKKERKNVVIVLPHSEMAHYDVNMINALQRQMRNRGISWEIIDADNFSIIPERLVHGIISLDYRDEKSVQLVTNFNVPIVAINEASRAADKVFSVHSDAENGMRMAMEHLKKLGHQKVMYFHHPADAGQNFCSHNRLNAFNRIAKTLGNVVWQEQTFPISRSNGTDFIRLVRQTIKNGFSALIIEGETGGTFACWHLHAAGIKVPEDISLIGWESHGVSENMMPPLTTIGQNFNALAEAAFDTLEMIWSGKTPPLSRAVAYQFFERSSTGKN